jgi:hypothetical protein
MIVEELQLASNTTLLDTAQHIHMNLQQSAVVTCTLLSESTLQSRTMAAEFTTRIRDNF